MGILNFTLLVSLLGVSSVFISCARNFDSVLQEPPRLENFVIYGKSSLDGSFSTPQGGSQTLGSLNDKPLILFFVGEFCQACIKETSALKKMIQDRGAVSRLRFATVMLDGIPEDIEPWFQVLEPQTVTASSDWLLGVDSDRQLFSQYFNSFVTPSILYFDPQTRILKRWQQAISLEQLEKETQSWY